jgi:hypothetical protein
MALFEVHRESHYGAHRLPVGKTAAGRTKRGRPADQAVKLFQDRQLQLSKVLAPFCEDRRILGSGVLERQQISRYLIDIFRHPVFFIRINTRLNLFYQVLELQPGIRGIPRFHLPFNCNPRHLQFALSSPIRTTRSGRQPYESPAKT